MLRSSKISYNRFATAYGRFFLFLILLVVFNIQSAPHVDQSFTFLQPDGQAVDVIVNGDEYYQHVESPDGYTLTRNSDGWICFASVSSNGSSLIPGEIYTGSNSSSRGSKHAELSSEAISKIREANKKVYDPESITKRNLETRYKVQKGNKIGLTILIDFSDQSSIVSKSSVEEMLNSDNYGSYGSAKKFFYDVSGGLLTYTNHVVGYYRARYPKSYYDTNSSGGKTRELLGEALDWLDNSNFDFGSISSSNKVITAVNFFYAGSPTWGWAKGLWPHMSSYTWNSNAGYKTSVYQITGLNTNTKSIGTFCHENGHMLLGYPDLYPYSGSTNWVGKYCLMSSGGSGSNPVPMNPYFRYKNGWLEYEDITSVQNGSYQATSNDPLRAFQYRNSSKSSEAFIIEALRKTGRYSGIPGSGLVVWKLNTNGTNTQADQNNPLLAVAGGTGTGALIANKSGAAFTSSTTPKATWPSGYSSNINIRNVSGTGATMTFDVGNGGTLDTMYTLDITANNGSVSTTPSGSSFKKGTSVSLTANANTGYQFVRWSGDASGTSNPTSITMNDNKSVTAVFEEKDPTYILTINSSNGSVTKSPNKSEYNPGETVTLTPKANSGYHFTGWGAEAMGFDQTLTVTMNSNKTIDAYFHNKALIEDPFFGTAGGNRAQDTLLRESFYGYGYSGGTVDTSDMFTSTGIKVGYSIPKQPDANTWPGADIMSFVNQSLDQVTHVRLTYKINRDSYILLTPEDDKQAPWLKTLTAKDEWYTVDIPVSDLTQPTDWGMETGTYNGAGIKNVGVSPIVDVETTSGNGTVFIHSMYLIGVTSDVEMVTLTATSDNGSITTSPNGSAFEKNTKVTLTAVPDAGYEFDSWSGDLSGSTNPVEITMDSDKNVTAIFVEESNKLKLKIVAQNGNVNLSPNKTEFEPGEKVKLISKANQDYYFTGWGGDINGFKDTLEITMNTDLTVEAYFHKNELIEHAEFGIAGGNRAINTDLQLSFYAYGYDGGTVDTSNMRTDTGITVKCDIPIQADTTLWPGAVLSSYVSQTVDSVRYVRLTYKCKVPVNLMLTPEGDMAPWLKELPATDTWKTVDIAVTDLKQPTDWGKETGTYDGTKIKDVALSPIVDVSRAAFNGEINIKGLYLIGIKDDITASTLIAGMFNHVTGLSKIGNRVLLSLSKPDNYSLEIFSINGRKILQLKGFKEAGTYDLSSQMRNLAAGLFISRLKTSEGVKTIRFTLSK